MVSEAMSMKVYRALVSLAEKIANQKTLVECDCEVKKLRPADQAATGGNREQGY